MTEANGDQAGVSPATLEKPPAPEGGLTEGELTVSGEQPAREQPDRPPITFQSMADRLTLGLLAAVIGAVLVFVSAFLTWSTVNARASSSQRVAGATTDSLGVAGSRLGSETLVLSLASLAVIAVMLLPATKPWAWKVLIGAGVLITLFALIDLISIPATLHPSNFTAPSGVTVSFHRTTGPGVWFTLFAGLLVTAGAYVHHIRPVPFRPPSGSAMRVSDPAVAEPASDPDPDPAPAEPTGAVTATAPTEPTPPTEPTAATEPTPSTEPSAATEPTPATKPQPDAGE